MEVVGRTIWNARQADATDIWPEFFGCDDHQRFAITAAAALPQRYPAPHRFHLLRRARLAYPVPGGPSPGAVCAATSKQFDTGTKPNTRYQTQRTPGSVLLTGHVPYRATPQLQGQMAVLENGTSRHGGLVLTGGTDHAPAPRQPNFSPPALWTDKSVRPTQRRQVGTTLLFSGKPAFHLRHPRIVLYHPFPLHVVVTGVNRIALLLNLA